jgi:TP901 family phage tail tape measure protein
MADIQSNIQVNIDASEALAQLKALQRQISTFHTSLAKNSAQAARAQQDLQNNLINSINATGKFSAGIREIKSTTESFTDSLERNKFSTREYFRFAAGSTKTFGKLFKSEFDTIGKVAEERVKTMQTQYIKMGRSANGALQSIAVRPLSLDMEDLSTKIGLAAQKQQLFGQLLKQGSTNLLNFGKNTQWAGRQLMVGFTIPLTIFGTKASQIFMDLEKQAIRFKRVYGEIFTTTEETDTALKNIRLLADEFTKYGIAVVDTMKLAADAAAMGKMGADLMAQVSEASRLAVLGSVEQSEALSTTIALQDAFGVSAEELAGKINFLNAVENQTVVSIEDLTIAIPKAGPVVKQLGGDVEDLAFFLTAMKEGGINASEGANALKSGLAALINPTKTASAFLMDFGVNINQIVESNQGNVRGVVLDFSAALDKLDPLNRARAIEQLFGKFQFSRLSTLFQNVTKDGTQASRVLDLVSQSTEELAILSERELKTLENATGTKFKNSMENLKTAIAPVGEEFLKAVTPIAEFVGKILEKFNNLGDGTKKALVVVATIIGAIGPVFLMTFGLIANGAANIIKLFATMRSGFLGLGKQSNQLAFQTQYMSSEQIEAATIAASLNQAHSKLIQTFTLESGAVDGLTNAYRRGIVAANNFAIANPGMMGPTKRKKFAAGGFVPGSGNKDTVPAMLTPGEFVVRKDAAQENKGFLQRLNKGGFVLRGDGSILKPGGVAGTVELHYGDALSGPQPTHVGGRLDGIRKNAGYTMLGDQGYNQLTIGSKKLGLPEPYPLTFSDAKKSEKILQDSLNNPIGKTSQSQIRMRTIALTQLQQDMKTIGERGWKNAMAQRTAVAAAYSENEKYPPAGKTYKAIYKAFQSSPGIDTQSLRNAYLKKVDLLWKSGALSDINRRNRGKISGKGTQHSALGINKKGQPPVSLASMMQDTMAATKNNKTFPAFRSLLNIKSGGIDPSGPTAKALALQGFTFPIRPIRRANGGSVPGYGEKDTVPALLTPGEFVVNKKATQENGPILEAMNSGKVQYRSEGTPLPPGMKRSSGGIILPPKFKDSEASVGINPQSADSAGKRFSTVVESGLSKASTAFASVLSRAIVGNSQDVLDSEISLQNPVAKLPSQDERTSAERVSAGGIIIPAGVKDPEANNKKQTTAAREITKQDREAMRVRNQMMMQKANMAAFGLNMVAQSASMLGGGIADKFAPMMMGLSSAIMAMSMVQGPISAAVVGIGAIAVAAVMVRRSFDKAQDETLAFAEQMGASSKNIRMFAETAGKVSAGEVMQRRREQKLGMYQIKPGKKTFGQAFSEGEQGKQVIKDIGKNIKQSGQAGAQSALVAQLATAVSSGAMNAEQARSVVANIAKELGDYSFGMSVNAQLISILGPNGENLMTDPLTVRTRLIEDTRQRMSTAAKATNRSTNVTGKDALNVGGTALAGAGAGAAMGAGIGATIGGVVSLGTLALPAAAVGAIAGTIIGGIAGATYGRKDRAKRLGETSGAQVALQKIALEQQQELLDSLDLEYQRKIELLKAEGKIAEAKKLQAEYDTNRQALVVENQKTTEQITTSFATSKAQSQLMTGADKVITAKYKDTALADVATLSTSTIDDMELEDEKKYTLKMQLASGQLNPMQVLDIVDIFKDKEQQERFFNITTKFGGAVSNEALSVASMFSGKDGANVKLQRQIMFDVEAAETSKEAQETIDFWNQVSKVGGVLDVSIIGDILQKDPNKQAQLMDIFKQVDAKKGKIDLKIATKILGSSPKAIAALNENLDYYLNLPAEDQKIYLKSLITTTETIDANNPEFQAYLREKGFTAREAERTGFVDTQLKNFANFKATQVTKTAQDASKLPGDGKKGGGGGERNTTFDDLLMRLKMVQDRSINALGGLKELKRVMSGKDAISLTKFKGIDQQLLGNGKVSQEFLDFIDSLGPEGIQKDLKKFVTMGKNGLMTLNEAGKAIMRGMVAAKLGEYQVNIRNNVLALKQQTQATSTLVKAGFTFAEAQELAKDQTLALAIANNELSPKQLQKLKEETQELTHAQKQYERVEKIGLMDAMDGQKARFEMVQKFVALQEQLIENQYASERAILSSRQEANEYALEKISQEEEKINEKYDKQIEALDKIAVKQEEINQIQQRRFGLAQALAGGDMAGAAGAIQEIRQAEALAQIERKRKAIEDARKKQLAGIEFGGKTREKIEADNKAIINSLSDIEERIRLAKNALDDELKKTIGMTRVEIEGAVTAIAKALDAGIDPKNKDFLGQILQGVVGDANATVTALKAVGVEVKALLAQQSTKKVELTGSGFSDEGVTRDGVPPVVAGIDQAAENAAAEKFIADEKFRQDAIRRTQGFVPSVIGTIERSMSTLYGPQATPKPKPKPAAYNPLNYLRIPMNSGGMVPKYMAMGGVVPKYFAAGGYGKGTDTIPAMLTPGEFVIQKRAVDMLGTGVMNSINNGELPGNSVYNYSLSVNVSNSNANPNDIARTVINQIKQIDAQRIRGNR